MADLTSAPGARAQARYVHLSPRKARRVIDTIRGVKATEALDLLRLAPQAASETVGKVLASAKTVAAVERLAKADRKLVAKTEQWDDRAFLINEGD